MISSIYLLRLYGINAATKTATTKITAGIPVFLKLFCVTFFGLGGFFFSLSSFFTSFLISLDFSIFDEISSSSIVSSSYWGGVVLPTVPPSVVLVSFSSLEFVSVLFSITVSFSPVLFSSPINSATSLF